MKLSKRVSGAGFALGIGLLVAVGANADPVATFTPTDDSPNIGLSGLSLTAAAAVVFDYQTPNLSAFGDMAATFNVSATETGAIAFGPIALGTFDGTFALTYSGLTRTAGGITVHTGDDLLSGTFLGSVFNGYGSTAGLVDSILGGGLVSFNNNNFLTFDGLGDSAIAWDFTSVDPTTRVIGGQLADFSAVSGGQFAADDYVEAKGKGGVPEPSTWTMMLAGFFGAGAALRRHPAIGDKGRRAKRRTRLAGRISALMLAMGLSALGASGANATTFASFRPSGLAPNMALSGLSLSASAPVLFKYLPSPLSAFGDLTANFSLTGTETGAIAFGPIALATFDGSFSFTYSGPTRTAGALTVHTGQTLLSGVFLGSVFNGYGSSASLTDSVLAGGLVSFNNNPFLTFSGLGDEGVSLSLTSLKPAVHVVGGQLTNFAGVSSGQFAADGLTTSQMSVHSFSLFSPSVPEPATWALMLTGFGLAGATLRRRRPTLAA